MGSEKLNFSSFDVEEALTSFPGVNDSVGFFLFVFVFVGTRFSATGQHFVVQGRV